MDEKRSLKRVEPFYYLRVYDANTRSYVGSVVDINKKGMKILSERLFNVDSVYMFKLPIPEDSIFGDAMNVEAKCCWCTTLPESSGYEAGFKFEKPVSDGVFAIESILKDLKKDHLI